MALLLGVLVVLPGCRTDSTPSYIRLQGAAPVLQGAPGTRAVLVTFWATWCPPCRKETPSLVELAQKPPEGLSVMVFSHDMDMAAVESFLRGPPAPALHLRLDEDHAAARAFGVETLPTAILVVDGQQVARFSGSKDWSSQAMRRLLEKLSHTGEPGTAP
ncbi:TlpA family protein disulfide reductase [Myxococcus stipitatus]|uniref:TlpA family protein disulfide reductase n=1 Tax=Myxococcus stipitatus TaxID=83455 RepID=UPI001E54980A|nr:TlpA disulfide reductase family protein [Myxococcus stipitatus]